MIKSFGQWIVVKDGIETAVGYEYWSIPKNNIMQKNVSLANELCKMPSINNKSLSDAFKFAYMYFHAMTSYSAKSHPEIHKKMMSEFKELEWHKSAKGNYTVQVSEGFNITVFKKKDRWVWVYEDIFSKGTYANVETAKKKAFASYYWFYEYIKKQKIGACASVDG